MLLLRLVFQGYEVELHGKALRKELLGDPASIYVLLGCGYACIQYRLFDSMNHEESLEHL